MLNKSLQSMPVGVGLLGLCAFVALGFDLIVLTGGRLPDLPILLLTLLVVCLALLCLLLARERHLLREQLAQAHKAAAAACEAKRRFLSNMNHELRTPLHGLLGVLQLLGASRLEATQQRWVDTATVSARHLSKLLGDILDLSALDADQLHIRAQPMNVCQTLREAMDTMAQAAQTKGLDLSLSTAMSEQCASATVLGDVTRVRQVLLSLIGNAIKFTSHGKVQVHVRSVPLAQQRLRWQVLVQDSSQGLSAETLTRMFRRFELSDPSMAREHSGLGVDLEISRALAQRMGGDVRAESLSGNGVVFVFEWVTPVAAPLVGIAEAQPVSERAHARTASVLVIDDHPVNRMVLVGMLRSLGGHAECAADGVKALERLQSGPAVDLVLMDLHMPHMDGFACLQAIRSLNDVDKANVPVVAVTADVLPQTQQAAAQAGFDGFLAKPIERERLEQLLALNRDPLIPGVG